MHPRVRKNDCGQTWKAKEEEKFGTKILFLCLTKSDNGRERTLATRFIFNSAWAGRKATTREYIPYSRHIPGTDHLRASKKALTQIRVSAEVVCFPDLTFKHPSLKFPAS
jgi:hypothetical protein